MRVAIACCGLEHVRRGFESAARELFNALSGQVDVILFKGSGPRKTNEIVVPCLRRDFLMRFMNPQRAFYWEQITFAIGLLPYLFFKKIDVVHFSEGNLGNALTRFLRWTRSPIKLLLWNGGPLSPQHFKRDLFIQQVSQEGLDLALEYGIEPARMHLIPYGLAPETLVIDAPREAARRRLGFPEDAFLVLSLAALNKEHKRLDYLIQEVAEAGDKSLFLCMAGEPSNETEELKELAQTLLPGRHRFMTVPRERVPELLASADLFVHAALAEGFGMVLLEACAAGVPLVCADKPHFRWVLGDAALYIDMTAAGALSSTIRRLANDQELLARQSKLGVARVDGYFSWKVLLPQYLEMYEVVCKS
ncbi:glycosyltransferase family 4 protein [Acidobacteria bacterium AB60]|nr:glycosyltransferase family 4 protein [Acidobacteria bacterium AB60]